MYNDHLPHDPDDFVARYRDLDRYIASLESLPEEKSSAVVLQILLLKLLKRFHTLLVGQQEDTMYAALITRQLLELLIVSEYVQSSEERALEFVGSFARDAVDIDEALIVWRLNLDANADVTDRQRSLAERREQITAKQYPRKYFSVARVAKYVEL